MSLFDLVGSTPQPRSIYLAGPMPEEAERGAVAPWRAKVQELISLTLPHVRVRWLVPEVAGCDHRGIAPSQTVEEDMRLLRKADGLVALLDDGTRYGTITEIGIAAGLGIPIAVAYSALEQCKGLEEMDAGMWGLEETFYTQVVRTNHSCPDMLQSEDDVVGWFWFPLCLAQYRAAFVGDDGPEVAARLAARMLTSK